MTYWYCDRHDEPLNGKGECPDCAEGELDDGQDDTLEAEALAEWTETQDEHRKGG